MFQSQFLLQKQQSRRSKISVISESLQSMENLIADQQIRIQQLQNFIMWIYDVSSKGRQATNIINAIQNFHSGTLMSSVLENNQQEVEQVPYSSQRNLTFFPISAASSLSKDQTFSIQSVPMNQSKIKDIQFSQSSRQSNLVGCPTNIKMTKEGVLKAHNRAQTLNQNHK